MKATTTESTETIDILAYVRSDYENILTPQALDFVAHLHRKFNARRLELLQKRQEREVAITMGVLPAFLPETENIRNADWQVAPIPADLQDRRVEITGPVDRKMIVNALNSGAKVFMADFEDSNSPTWDNLLEGQINLYDAIRRQIDFDAENGKRYSLNQETAVLKVRPRGWHLNEKHLLIDNEPIAGGIFDFGLYFFHNAQELLNRGVGPYFYLPKLENHLEARLWNDIFIEAQNLLGIQQGTIKVTVLIETILAAFEMDEIIYELREHLAGLNAGRWDYIFSCIKKFRNDPTRIFPDRVQVSMAVPFMTSYCTLLVQTCHKRKAHAIGGMSAFIPSRKNEAVNRTAFEKVLADKQLEANRGFDGTWVAHPDLVKIAVEPFNKAFGDKANQKDYVNNNLEVTAEQLIDFRIPNTAITESGLRMNINVGILYIESWLRGVGAAAIHNLMEDAATAEISRAQVWQWLKHGAKTHDGQLIEHSWYKNILNEEVENIKAIIGDTAFAEGKYQLAIELFDEFVTKPTFDAFLTTEAYYAI